MQRGEVADSIPGAGPILRVLKYMRNEGAPFALQAARPSLGSDDLLKWRSDLQLETGKKGPPLLLSNPGPLYCESNALTTWSRCLLASAVFRYFAECPPMLCTFLLLEYLIKLFSTGCLRDLQHPFKT